MNKTIWGLVGLNTLLGIGHHIDHTLRGNVGWPLTDQVNGYTGAFSTYIVVVVGAILTRRRVVGPGFWAIVSAVVCVYVTVVHFAPHSPDPVSMYASAYGSRVKGALAIGWVLLTIAITGFSAVYCAARWSKSRQAPVPRPAS